MILVFLLCSFEASRFLCCNTLNLLISKEFSSYESHLVLFELKNRARDLPDQDDKERIRVKLNSLIIKAKKIGIRSSPTYAVYAKKQIATKGNPSQVL